MFKAKKYFQVIISLFCIDTAGQHCFEVPKLSRGRKGKKSQMKKAIAVRKVTKQFPVKRGRGRPRKHWGLVRNNKEANSAYDDQRKVTVHKSTKPDQAEFTSDKQGNTNIYRT